jgi:hypothetical protein
MEPVVPVILANKAKNLSQRKPARWFSFHFLFPQKESGHQKTTRISSTSRF